MSGNQQLDSQLMASLQSSMQQPLQQHLQQMQQSMQPMQQPLQPMQQLMQPMQQFGQQQSAYNPFDAIAKMQRQPMQQPVMNPFFGGQIPMNFGLPEASRIPADFQSALQNFERGTPLPPPVDNSMSAVFDSGNVYGGNFNGGNNN